MVFISNKWAFISCVQIKPFIISDKPIKISNYMPFCWFFYRRCSFVGKIRSLDKVGIVVPGGESVFENRVDSMPQIIFSLFFSVQFKKSSVTN